jgi:hypothetical protein
MRKYHMATILWPHFLHHHHWHTLRKDAFPSGKVGFIPLRQSSRLINGQRREKIIAPPAPDEQQ